MPRARRPAGDPPLGSRLRGRGHARDLADARAGDREGGRRSRPVRAQGARLRRPGRCRRQVAAFLGWPHVTNVAARRALRRHAPAHAADGLRRGGVRGARCRSSSPSAFRPEQATERRSPNGPIEVWQATDLVDDLQPNDKRFGQTGSPTRVLAVRDARPERAGIRAASAEEAAAKVRGAARGARARATELGEARPHRRGARCELRLLERLRARRRPAAASLARADRQEPRAGGKARRAGGRAPDRPRARRACARGGAARGRGRLPRGRSGARRVPAGAVDGGPPAASSSSTRRACCWSPRRAAGATTARAPPASSSSG